MASALDPPMDDGLTLPSPAPEEALSPETPDDTTSTGIRWGNLGVYLDRADLRAIRGRDREKHLREWREIAARERALEDRLFLGIIGGTGVGKSTLINAIAAAPISYAGDRRPTTSRVVAYRHRRLPLPDSLPRGDLAEPEAVHDQEVLERLVILDFPDFDSVEADHAAILARFLPLLDVLLVVVDDEKYGDLRLFEVLRGLPQAHRNIHFILNKVDRLVDRYPGRAHRVARDILTDLAWKLSTHAGLRPDPSLLLAVSARVAFERRFRAGGIGDGGTLGPVASGGEKGPGSPAPGRREGAGLAEKPEGDFPAVLDLLEGYRAEKRRRAAKEANLDARKAALVRAVRAAGLDSLRRGRAASLRKAIQERREEMEGILASIGPEAVGPRELRRLYGAALGRAGPRLPFPLGWILLLFGGKKEVAPPGPAEVTALARAHYLPYREALRSAERELLGEVEEIAGPPAPAVPAPITSERGEELLAAVRARLGRALRLGRLRAHLVPAVLIAGGLWFILHPVIAHVARSIAEGNSVEWGSSGAQALAALIAALSPSGIVSFLITLGLAYLLVAYLDWRRIRRAVDGAVAGFEKAVREDVRAEARAVFERIEAPLGAWERERKELETILG